MFVKISHLLVVTISQTVLVCAASFAWSQMAQSQTVQIIKPPKEQLRMDVTTGSKSSEMSLAFWNSKHPGLPVTMDIPPAMLMGESLSLLPPKPDTVTLPENVRKTGADAIMLPSALPKGRLLLYWGCSAKVPNGQPRSIDFSKPDSANAPAFAAALAGTYVPDSDASFKPGLVVFPNDAGQKTLPSGASLVGTHRIKGEGVAPSFAFNLADEHDVMPAIELRKTGTLQDSMLLSWTSVKGARAYFLHAISKQGDDTIFWSSSALKDAGTAVFNHLPNATLDRWVKDRLLLDSGKKECAIPKGILEGQGAVLRMMAFGGEHYLAFPSKPDNPKVAWEPEWALRLRLQSHITTVLGESAPAAIPSKDRDMLPPDPAILLRDPTNLLRGILGG